MITQDLIGSMINNYELLDHIGQGGMGDVFLARHPQIGKQVAIKLLRQEYSKNAEATRRFFHEARVVSEINHPNVVDVLDFGETASGACYITMEYLEGESLTSYIKAQGPLPTELVGHIGLQLCAVLAAAHRKNIVHRDLKSDNIFLIERDSTDNFVKLFDFGIAKLLDEQSLTMDGMTMGTPTYMSPEQALGRDIDGRTDIYALGVLMYLM
jgi:serine/threonine protein kinase